MLVFMMNIFLSQKDSSSLKMISCLFKVLVDIHKEKDSIPFNLSYCEENSKYWNMIHTLFLIMGNITD